MVNTKLIAIRDMLESLTLSELSEVKDDLEWLIEDREKKTDGDEDDWNYEMVKDQKLMDELDGKDE
jgi:hypothetical protein